MPGTYSVSFDAVDNSIYQNPSKPKTHLLFITNRPSNLKSLLSLNSNLQELLLFYTGYFRKDPTHNLDAKDLQDVFYQDFARLSDPFNMSAQTILNKSCIHIEILKKFLTEPENDLVAHWKLDEGAGLKTIDSTNNNNIAVFVTIPGQELVAHWKLDEPRELIAFDSSGFNNRGYLSEVGPVWKPSDGKIGGCLSFCISLALSQ